MGNNFKKMEKMGKTMAHSKNVFFWVCGPKLWILMCDVVLHNFKKLIF